MRAQNPTQYQLSEKHPHTHPPGCQPLNKVTAKARGVDTGTGGGKGTEAGQRYGSNTKLEPVVWLIMGKGTSLKSRQNPSLLAQEEAPPENCPSCFNTLLGAFLFFKPRIPALDSLLVRRLRAGRGQLLSRERSQELVTAQWHSATSQQCSQGSQHPRPVPPPPPPHALPAPSPLPWCLCPPFVLLPSLVLCPSPVPLPSPDPSAIPMHLCPLPMPPCSLHAFVPSLCASALTLCVCPPVPLPSFGASAVPLYLYHPLSPCPGHRRRHGVLRNLYIVCQWICTAAELLRTSRGPVGRAAASSPNLGQRLWNGVLQCSQYFGQPQGLPPSHPVPNEVPTSSCNHSQRHWHTVLTKN